MNNLAGMGGPAGAQRMQNVGTPGPMPVSPPGDHKRKLNTYIYDYFLKNGQYDLARSLYKEVELDTSDKPSPNRKGINGDGMDGDSKLDDINRPADLPRANVPGDVDSPFLLDWWSQFWDCWTASRSKAQTSAKQYLDHVQMRQTAMQPDRRGMSQSQMAGMNPRGMMPNGIPMNNDMKKAMMMQGGMQPGRPNQQQLQQYRMAQVQQQQQLAAQQTQMQREGSQMDANGQGRPQTPASGDAPSPKRQRIESGNFNGPMGGMGRGQNPGLPNAQFNGMQMQTPNGQAKPMQVYGDQMRQQMHFAMISDGEKGMQNPAGLPQGSPAVEGMDMFNNANLRAMGGQPTPGGPGGPGGANNHALQDYQMQLMLLEQQNKKRLLMARQEQDSQGGPGGPMPGQQGFNAPAMSPSNSRAGPSPNPDDQMKRGTPKMAGAMVPGGLDALQGRGSPIPGFDPSQMNQGMGPNFQGMKMPGAMMGPNGQMMAAASHPAFNAQMNGQMNGQLNPQQLAMMQQRAAAGGAGGPWGQGPPPGMMHPGQPQPNMTPQQRNSAMPPPPAPATGDNQNRTQPSSPSQNAAPPTPSQANKPNPKKKDAGKANKKLGNKKNSTTGATPSETGDQPPTPTPAPPITPTAPSQQFNKGGPGAGMPNAMGQQDITAGPFGDSLDGSDMNFGMDFGGLDGQDVLDNFDFDAFLTNENGDGAFAFDASMGFGADGLEAGGDV